MYRKKAAVNMVWLCIINVFIWFSKFTIEFKIISIFCGILLFVLYFAKREKAALWIGVYVITMLILNTICFARVHYNYIKTYNNLYNVKTQWMTTQTDYTWNTGNSEVILSSIFRNKQVYVFSDDKYVEYIRYFSEGLCFFENNLEVDFEKLKEEFIPLGRMTPYTASWLWTDDMRKELSILRGDVNTTPRIFVSSEYVANKHNLVAISDEGYNLYIWSYEEFQKE